jgi:hypothetical protein
MPPTSASDPRTHPGSPAMTSPGLDWNSYEGRPMKLHSEANP